MKEHTFTDNGSFDTGIAAASGNQWHTLAYDGDLGGGTLQVFGRAGGGAAAVPIPDSKLAAGRTDGNGDTVKVFRFVPFGEIRVTLSGATSPDVTIWIE